MDIKLLSDPGLAEHLRQVVQELAGLLKVARDRSMNVCILAKPYNQQMQQYQGSLQGTHQITQHDTPVVASITRTKSETF